MVKQNKRRKIRNEKESNCRHIIIPSFVTEIEHEMISSSNLESVSIPSSVTSINENAFNHCSQLKSITFPSSITEIGQYAFVNCINLKKIILSSKITHIHKGVFADCHNLASVELPNSLISIEDEAFKNCYSLIDITIPEHCSVTANAFTNCFTLDVKKIIEEVFGPLNIKDDNNIRQLIANVIYLMNSYRNEQLLDLIPCMKQIYDILKPKEDFGQLLKLFLPLIIPLKSKIRCLKYDFQFNKLYKEITNENINEKLVKLIVLFVY